MKVIIAGVAQSLIFASRRVHNYLQDTQSQWLWLN